MRVVLVSVLAGLLFLSAGCATLQEVRGKTKVGPEWQHSGTSGTDSVRYCVQPGIELKWSNGVSTAISYRRRDIDDGNGSKDQAVFVDIAVPLWKAKKKDDRLASRVEQLERALTEIRATKNVGQEMQ